MEGQQRGGPEYTDKTPMLVLLNRGNACQSFGKMAWDITLHQVCLTKIN